MKSWLNLPFFLLPFFLCLGISIQATAVYLLLLGCPLFALILYRQSLPTIFPRISWILLGLYGLFPLTSILAWLIPHDSVPVGFSYQEVLNWNSIFTSRFPSAFLVIPIIFLMMGVWLKRRSHTAFRKSAFAGGVEPLASYLWGLAISGLCFYLFLRIQYQTGIDWKLFFKTGHWGALSLSEAFSATAGDKVYRTIGLYGHPLTVAGVCLNLFAFSWTLFWFCWFKGVRTTRGLGLPLFIAVVQGACLPMAGGRTALVAAGIVALAVPVLLSFFLNSRSLRRKLETTLITVVLLLPVAGVMGWGTLNHTEIGQRMQKSVASLTTRGQLEGNNNRTIFWQVYTAMFKDSPVFGQGYFWVQKGLRTAYYNQMGYTNLKEKFPAHNVYLEVLGTSGLFGFFSAGILVFLLLKRLRRYACQSHLQGPFLGFIVSICANMIHGITQNVFFDSTVVYSYLALLLIILWEGSLKIRRRPSGKA